MSSKLIDLEKLGDLSARQVVLGTLVVLGVGAGAWLIYRFYLIFFIFLVALMLHIAMRPVVEVLHRRGVPEGIGVVTVYVGVVILLVAFGFLLFPVVSSQFQTVGEHLPTYYQNVRAPLLASQVTLLRSVGNALPVEFELAGWQNFLAQPIGPSASTATGTALGRGAQSLLIILSVFMIAFYWTLDRERILYKLMLKIPPARRAAVRTLIAEMEAKVGGFYRGELILCSFVGGLALVVYWAIGLPYALLLALLAFLCEIVPMIGPALGALPAVLVALAFAPDKIIWVILANVLIQLLENNILVPKVMDKAVGVNAIVSILAMAAFSFSFGLVGALLAIPLAAMIQIVLNHLLFDATAQPTTIDQVTVEMNATEKADSVRVGAGKGSRNHLSVLRLEAQDLVQDVRKRLHTHQAAGAADVVQVEEMMELLATEVDGLLLGLNQGTLPAAILSAARQS